VLVEPLTVNLGTAWGMKQVPEEILVYMQVSVIQKRKTMLVEIRSHQRHRRVEPANIAIVAE
jgi:hypothetical protein